jgi:AraC-like DNA-binding protein
VHLRWFNGKLSVAGPDLTARIELAGRAGIVVGFTFQPGAARHWLGLPIDQIFGRRIDLEQLWGTQVLRLAEFAGEAGSAAGIARRLEAGLVRRSANLAYSHEQIRQIFAMLEADQTQRGVTALIDWFGLSARTLRRRCDGEFGYGAKTLERILRFQRFLKLAGESRASQIADWALEAGYAGQAHLSREARRISALPPSRVVEQLIGRFVQEPDL